jgi:acyl-CoA synthetase (AMP-forming)/AMP-acid ligase II/Tfp pilus assembly protein PilF
MSIGLMDFRNLATSRLGSDSGHAALVCDDEVITYSEMAQRIERAAGALAGLGVSRGDRIGLLIYNRPEMAELYFACFRIGAVAVPINNRYHAKETNYAIDHCQASVLIVERALYEGLEDIQSSVASLAHVVLLEDDWETMVARADSPPDIDLEADDPAVIYYTSGSTSRPKGVTHTHATIRNTAESHCITKQLAGDDIWMIASSMCHIGGSMPSLFPGMLVGSTVVILRTYDSANVIAHVQRHHPTRAFMLPTAVHDVLVHPDASTTDFSCFREFCSAGDVVSDELRHQWAEVAPIPLTQFIGMTECDAYSWNLPGGPRKVGSVGKPRHGVEVRIVDEAGEPVGVDQNGEIVLRSNSMTVGYWDDPKATSQTIRNGWLHSGDRGRIDEDGFLWFVGRIKEIIVRGGSNIAPGEVEGALDQHPDVLESAVIGAPDKRFGQIVTAYVEPDPDADTPLTEAALVAWSKDHLAAYKVPERWTFLGSLPRNAVGKVDRALLHKVAAGSSQIRSLWDFDDPEASEVRFKQLLPISQQSDGREYHVELMTQIARAQGLQRNFDQANATLDAAESLVTDDMPRAGVRLLLERGRVLNSAGKTDEARPFFQKAWEMARRAGTDDLAVDAAHMAAIVSEADKAHEWNKTALELAEASNDAEARRWCGSLHNNMGWTDHGNGDYKPAMVHFEAALAARVKQGDPHEIEIARWCIARCLRSLKRVDEALVMQRELETEKASGYVYEEIAECLYTLDRVDEARPYFHRAAETLGADPWLAKAEPRRIQRLIELGSAT